MKHQPFELLAQGDDDHIVFIVADNAPLDPEVMMKLSIEGYEVFITKAQCMEFFGLVDPDNIPVADLDLL